MENQNLKYDKSNKSNQIKLSLRKKAISSIFSMFNDSVFICDIEFRHFDLHTGPLNLTLRFTFYALDSVKNRIKHMGKVFTGGWASHVRATRFLSVFRIN